MSSCAKSSRLLECCQPSVAVGDTQVDTLPDNIICRCEEVQESEISEAIRQGARSLTGIKVRTRAGMGLCQGKTCQRLVARMLAAQTDQKLADIIPITARPPCRPVQAQALAQEDDDASQR